VGIAVALWNRFTQGLDTLMGSPQLPQGGVMGEPQVNPRQDARLALASSLLAGSNSGRGFNEIFGKALMAGQAARQQAQQFGQQSREQQSQEQLRQAQAEQLRASAQSLGNRDGQFGNIDVDQFTPESLAAFQQTGDYGVLKRRPDANIGNFNPGDYTPESFAKFRESGNITDLKRFVAPATPSVSVIGGVPTLVSPDRNTGGARTSPLSSLGTEADAAGVLKGSEAAAGAAGAAQSQRYSAQVDTGLDAADSLATVKQGLTLLDEVKTGGLNNVKLKVSNIFGVTGADEAQLSANLGKAVLSQLRATFGAAFTEREGSRLAEIEAGFGKSTAANRRLLEQAQKILERAARRGITSAQALGDEQSAQEIREAMDFSLGKAPAAGGWKIEPVQ
jgi:hypothetical protein